MDSRTAHGAATIRAALASALCLFGLLCVPCPAPVLADEPPREVRRGGDGLLLPGSYAPDFTLQDQDGRTVRLMDRRGASLVLYFYPMDDTPGCTKEACSFRDTQATYDSLRVSVIGVSTDDRRSHRAFAAKHDLGFPLLADTTGHVSRLYGCGVEIEQQGSKRWIASRVTYLIDAEGIIRKVWPKVNPTGHAEEILPAIAALPPAPAPVK